MELCAICGKPAECKHHLIFGRGLRELADQDMIYIYLCNRHHNLGSINERIHDNTSAEALSKMLGEALWIIYQDIDNKRLNELKCAFIKRYGRNYL